MEDCQLSLNDSGCIDTSATFYTPNNLSKERLKRVESNDSSSFSFSNFSLEENSFKRHDSSFADDKKSEELPLQNDKYELNFNIGSILNSINELGFNCDDSNAESSYTSNNASYNDYKPHSSQSNFDLSTDALNNLILQQQHILRHSQQKSNNNAYSSAFSTPKHSSNLTFFNQTRASNYSLHNTPSKSPRTYMPLDRFKFKKEQQQLRLMQLLQQQQQQHKVDHLSQQHVETFSKKVFVGGLPPDIDEEEIAESFRRFGALHVDWPHKSESKSYFPPKGYCFVIFEEEASVGRLMESCVSRDEKLFWSVSSPTVTEKLVQVRPWCLRDADFVMDNSVPIDPQKTIFVGGVPRPLRAVELALIIERLYGGVSYTGIDLDPDLKYPKGAARVAFHSQQSYIAAVNARFVQLQYGDIDKRVEVKPYVLDDQICRHCESSSLQSPRLAPFFCANVTCLQYFCEDCWVIFHSNPDGRAFHKPLVREGTDRPRVLPFK